MELCKTVSDHIAFSREKMKKMNLFTTERLFCDVYCLEPGQSQTPHSHDASDKVYYVLSGEGSVTVGAATHSLPPGEIVLAPAGSEHGIRNDSNGRLTTLVFMSPKP